LAGVGPGNAAPECFARVVPARGGIGTNHIDGDTRLCTATAAESLTATTSRRPKACWARILDRLAGPDPPALLCVDPRRTPVAEHATVHLAPIPGTNMALMNDLLHIAPGRIAAEQVTPYPPRIPVLVPGELVDYAVIDNLRAGLAAGMNVPDPADPELHTLRVVAR
jgi:hypothetical protein